MTAPDTAKKRSDKKLSVMGRIDALPRVVKIAAMVVIAVFFYALPLLELPLISTEGSDFGAVMFTVASYALVALGLNIVIGYAGLLDLGYVGFYAVGAYSVGVLTSSHAHLPFLLVIPIAVVAAMVSGVLLGAPTLRVRGDYLAIVTLGFGEIIRLVANNTAWLGEAGGINQVGRPPNVTLFDIPHLSWDTGAPLVDLHDKTTVIDFGITDQIPYYWLALTIVIVMLFADGLIKDSRVGRAWEATREDEDAAELMGVPTFRYKLLAFAMGAFIGGLAGALYASKTGFINPESFVLILSILFVAAVVVGGQGSRWGVIVGAALVAYLPERFRGFEDWRILVFGLALMAMAAFRPQGLLPPRRTVLARKVEQEIELLEEGELEGGGKA